MVLTILFSALSRQCRTVDNLRPNARTHKAALPLPHLTGKLNIARRGRRPAACDVRVGGSERVCIAGLEPKETIPHQHKHPSLDTWLVAIHAATTVPSRNDRVTNAILHYQRLLAELLVIINMHRTVGKTDRRSDRQRTTPRHRRRYLSSIASLHRNHSAIVSTFMRQRILKNDPLARRKRHVVTTHDTRPNRTPHGDITGDHRLRASHHALRQLK